MLPKVSVIIPFYQHAEWLIEALDSVFIQSYPKDRMEVIVVNDGSRENVEDAVSRYGESLILLSQENGGAASARNRGIECAAGDYIAFLDADDIWTENKLNIQVNAMEKSGSLWSYMSYETFGKIQKHVPAGEKVTNHFPQILYSSSIATPTVMIRKDLFSRLAVQKFDCSLQCGEDFDLWIRLSRIENVLTIPDIGARVRIREDSTMRSVVRQLRVRAQISDRIRSFDEYQSIPTLCRAGYTCSKKAYGIFARFEKPVKNGKMKTLIAAFLYVIPYMLFKLGLLMSFYSKAKS